MKSDMQFLIVVFIVSFIMLVSCKKQEVPTLTTSEVINITGTTAISGGTITDEGSGTILTRGVCWSTGSKPTISDYKSQDGAGAGSFASQLSSLNGGTSYFIRAYATNSVGTGYGMAMSFKTLGQIPVASSESVTNRTSKSIQVNGTVNAQYLETIVSFEYGYTTSYGNTVIASQSPVTSNTAISVSAIIEGLLPYTTYHFRVKAVNSLGTSYGNDMEVTTLLSDVDGNEYNVIQVGTQIWMAENLKTKKYSNGEIISSGTYAQNNNENNVTTYGRLYTWYVAADSRNVCPTGWHVPKNIDWNTLLTNVQSPDKLKEAGFSHWLSPNTGATNSVLFTALPGGYIDGSVTIGLRATASFWLNEEIDANTGRGFMLYYDNSPTTGDYVHSLKNIAFSIRCLKD